MCNIKCPPGESYYVPPQGSEQWGCPVWARAVSFSAGCYSCSRPQLRPWLPPLPLPASCKIRQGQINSSNTHKHRYGWTMHTHSSAALHKTHAMIIRISICLLWHDGALLRLQCAVLHPHCTHQCKTTAAFVLSTLTPLMLSWGIFSVHLLTLKSPLEIARFEDIHIWTIQQFKEACQRFLQFS